MALLSDGHGLEETTELDPTLPGGVIDEVTPLFSEGKANITPTARRRASPDEPFSNEAIAHPRRRGRVHREEVREGSKGLWPVCGEHDEQAELGERDVGLD